MVLEDRDVIRLIEELQGTFAWGEEQGRPLPVGRWRSKTSSFYSVQPWGGGRGVVLKVGNDWDAEDARIIHEQLGALQDLVKASGLDIKAPAVLGWLPDPPSICIELIEGEDLDEILDRTEGYMAPMSDRTVEECGALLGLFHSSEEPAGVGVGEPGRAASDRLAMMLEQLRIRSDFSRNLDIEKMIAPRYGDYAPYNVRIDPTGQAWLLDQPAPRSFDLIHRDVAWYTFALLRNVGRGADPASEEVLAARDRLMAAFVVGYARTGPSSMGSRQDQLLLSLHYAHFFLWAAKRRWRQRRYQEVPANLRLAWRWRAVALRAMKASGQGSAGVEVD